MSDPQRVDTKYLGGEHLVEPGHPITLAYLITKCYAPSADISKALSDDVVPGSIDSLSYAVNGLLAIRRGTATLKEFIEKSNRFWARTCERLGQDAPGTISGQVQADNLVGPLEQVMKGWLR